MANRDFDVVIWGVTGFTGRLAAKYIAKEWGPSGTKVKYAIAGRSAEKLAEVSNDMAQVGPGTDTVTRLQADVNDAQAMVELCKRTTVLVAMAGPFDLVGEAAVKACVEAGTHYVDITGETHWVKRMHDKYHEQAKKKGVQIVPCCGYDYVISDVTAFNVLDHVKSKGGASEILAVEQVVDAVFAGFSSGTKASMMRAFSKMSLGTLLSVPSPYAMCESPPNSEVVVKKNRLLTSLKFSENFNCWTHPDVMGMGMTQHFHWGNQVGGFPYGKNVVYGVGAKAPNLLTALFRLIKMQLTFLSTVVFSRFPNFFKHMSGTGPAVEQSTGLFVNMKTAVTAVVDGQVKTYIGEGHMDKDPYQFAAIGCLKAATAILEELKTKTQKAAGVLPPSGAFGKEFCKQLKQEGMRFTVKEV